MPYDYVKAFKKGHFYNKMVASFLNDNGINCYAPELKIAQNSQEIREMTQTEKDIVLTGIHDGVLEVKTSSREFGWDPADFPYSETIVDTVSSYEEKIIKPLAYVLVSQKTEAMVALPPSTKSRWKVRRLYDNKQELWDDFYVIQKQDIAEIGKLINYLLLHQE
jgi:hypothetical protein